MMEFSIFLAAFSGAAIGISVVAYVALRSTNGRAKRDDYAKRLAVFAYYVNGLEASDLAVDAMLKRDGVSPGVAKHLADARSRRDAALREMVDL